jgi:hypothetical protein
MYAYMCRYVCYARDTYIYVHLYYEYKDMSVAYLIWDRTVRVPNKNWANY